MSYVICANKFTVMFKTSVADQARLDRNFDTIAKMLSQILLFALTIMGK